MGLVKRHPPEIMGYNFPIYRLPLMLETSQQIGISMMDAFACLFSFSTHLIIDVFYTLSLE